MAKAVITDIKTGYVGSVSTKDYATASVTGEAHSLRLQISFTMQKLQTLTIQ